MDSDSRNDRIPILREQVTRIYMTTVAANEREERLLSKKLDALDLEHRAEYLRMKKIIFNTRQDSKRKLLQGIAKDVLIKEYRSQAPNSQHILKEETSNEDNIITIPTEAATTVTDVTIIATTAPVKTNEHEINSKPIVKDSEFAVTQDKHESKGECHRRKEKKPPKYSKSPEDSESLLHDKDLTNRIKYTESEVKRLKTSWRQGRQGRRSPKHGRKARTFLPHLAKDDSVVTFKTFSKLRPETEDDSNFKLPNINTKQMSRRNRQMDPGMNNLNRGKTIATIKELNENSAIGLHRRSRLPSAAHLSVIGRQRSDPLPMVSSKK